MAIKDLLHPERPQPPAERERPYGITCPKYVRGEGKRCIHFAAGGACQLPDELLCVEWLKVNRPRSPASVAVSTLPRDLFGEPVAESSRPEIGLKSRPSPATDVRSSLAPAARSPTEGAIERPPLSPADVESFRALGVEVRLSSDACGDIWLGSRIHGPGPHGGHAGARSDARAAPRGLSRFADPFLREDVRPTQPT